MQSLSDKEDAIVYILQLTPLKLSNPESQALWKSYILHLFEKAKDNDKNLVIVEVYLVDDIGNDETHNYEKNLEEHMDRLLKILINGYNMMEPDHSGKYTL